MKRQYQPHGFTLIELLIAISVAGILLSIAIPSFSTMIRNNRLATQTNQIIAAINFARSEAIKRNTGITFCRANTITATTCAGGNDANNWSTWIVLANGTNVRSGTVDSSGGTIVVRSNLSNNSMLLSPDGLAQTGNILIANQSITVCATNSTINNRRVLTLGTGSRLSTAVQSGGCP